MPDDSMQYLKRSTGATPLFDGERHGTVNRGIGADRANGPAGGEIRREKFANDPMVRSPRVADAVRR
jgi:hypothetical protein